MELEERLKDYLQEATITNTIYSCEISFYRDLAKEELNYMNEQMKHTDSKIICFPCETCAEYSNGKEKYHIDRVRR